MSLVYTQKTRLVPKEPPLYQFRKASGAHDRAMIEKGNVYVDMLLETLVREEKGAFVTGSYIAKDAIAGFCRRYLFTRKGRVLIEMPTGVLNGLDTLHRTDDCCFEEKDGKLFIHAVLGAGTLDFRYFGRIQIGNYYPQVLFDVNLDFIEIFLDYSVDAVTGKDGTFHRFEIVDLKGFRISLANLWPLNKVLNMVLGRTTRLFKGYLTEFIENQLKMYIAEKLPYFSFPSKKEVAEKPSEVAEKLSKVAEEKPESSDGSEDSGAVEGVSDYTDEEEEEDEDPVRVERTCILCG